MRHNAVKGFLALFLALGFIASGFAERQAGAISGRVLDERGAPLPGAAILISGPSLLGTNIYLTASTGAFRFPVLLPGTYALRIEMPGFKTEVRPGLEVRVGRTTDVVVRLEPTAIEEEITVAAPSPVVDIASSKRSTHYGAALLPALPLNRDLYDIQNAVPGAISEGDVFRRTSSILGGSVRGQIYALDGTPLNDPADGHAMVNINTDVLEEIEFAAGGLPAEIGRTDATYVNIVGKSGGNAFSGALTAYLNNDSLAADLWTPEQLAALGVNAPEKIADAKDVSLSLGGPILPDRAWFFLSGRRLAWRQLNPGNAETRMAALGFADSVHYDAERKEWLAFAKLSVQPAKDIRYMGMFHFNNVYEPVNIDDIAGAADLSFTRTRDRENVFTTGHQLHWTPNQNTFLDIRGSYIFRRLSLLSRDESEYSHYDFNRDVWWGSAEYSIERTLTKYAASASVTRFLDDFLGAAHELKAGVEFEQAEHHRDWYHSNPYYALWRDYTTGNLYDDSPSARRGTLRVLYGPAFPGLWDVQDHFRRFSGFVQDSLRAGRLAVNLGLRVEYSTQYQPDQGRPDLRYPHAPAGANPEWAAENPNALLEALIAEYRKTIGPVSPWDALAVPWRTVVDFFTVSPRLGFVYDLTGDGKTAVKLSLARYTEPVWMDKYGAAQIFGPGSVRWIWTDTNGNGLLDLPPIDDYVFDAGFSNPVQSPDHNPYPENLKAPRTDEFLIGVDRELFKDVLVSLEFLYRRSRNLVEDVDVVNGYDPDAVDENGNPIWLPFTFTDPGGDNTWGTADDRTMTVYGLRADRPASAYEGGNPPEARRRYGAVILSLNKRLSNNWQMSGSILYSAFVGNSDPGSRAGEGRSSLFQNPNAMIHSYGPLWADRPLQVKLMGSAVLPRNIVLSAYLRHFSGSPWNRTLGRVYFPQDFGAEYGGVTASYVTVNAEEPGSRRTRAYTNLDLRVEKIFALDGIRLHVFLDVFNAAGWSGVNVDPDPAPSLRYDLAAPVVESSPTYGNVTSVSGVRSFRIGLRLNY